MPAPASPLERDGVITGYRATLDRPKVGLGVTVFVELKVWGTPTGSPATSRQRSPRCRRSSPCHIVSGSADFLLEVVVADLSHYERLLLDTLLTLPGVADVRSNFALRTVKQTARCPSCAPRRLRA